MADLFLFKLLGIPCSCFDAVSAGEDLDSVCSLRGATTAQPGTANMAELLHKDMTVVRTKPPTKVVPKKVIVETL